LRQLRLVFGALAACLTLVLLPLDENCSGPGQARAQGVAVNIYIDRAQNENFLSEVEADMSVGFVYEAKDGRLQLADEGIMNVWKGHGPVRRLGAFEDTVQFAPVFLVVDIMNNEARKIGIVGGYLQVAESFTDRTPYLEILTDYDPSCVENMKLRPDFDFINRGWGPVENAKITYAFGTEESATTRSFVQDVGTFDEMQAVSVLPGLEAAGLDAKQASESVFDCPSLEQIAGCAQGLGSGVLGELANAVFPHANSLYSRIRGQIDYTWTDSRGGTNARSTPFVVDIPILSFNAAGGIECGAGGPVERTFNTVKLPLDKANYRIALPYKDTLAPQQNKRFALSLIADKSSGHKFRVVLDLADGTYAASPEIDLLYFLPRMNLTN
jgi:hypothetical protein